MTLRSVLLRGVALAAAAGAQPLLAQAPAVETAQVPAADAAADSALREIVVTAQRRQDSIQSIPVAVTALDRRALDAATVEDLRDFGGRVPSLVVDNVAAGPSAAAISIRGISFEDIEKSFDPAVGVVVDGVFIGTNTGQLLDSFDMERLEVLRGPQGTLFGRNTIGGVISVTRTRPTDDFGVRGQFAYSNFDTKRGRLVVNTGKLGGFIAIKAFGFYDNTDGFYDNVTKDRREGQYEVLTGGVTALITPTDGITAQVTYEHMRERGETIVGSLSESGRDLICAAPGIPGFAPAGECNRSGLPGRGLYTTFSQIDTPVRNDTDAVTGNIDIELGENFTLTSVTGYRTNDESVRQDFDASSAAFFETLREQEYRQFSQELRVVGDVTDSINLLIGGFYFDSNYKLDQTTTLGAVLAGGAPALLRQYVDHSTKSYAGFADVRFKVSDRLTIGAGGRYTQDDKEIFNNFGRIGALVSITQPGFDGQSCVAVTGVISPAPGVVLPAYGPASNCSGQQGFGQFTWRASIDYEFADSQRVYASYNKGFRSGGFNGRASGPTTLGPYDPETVDAYEIGLKADWLDKTLRTNIAAYYSKYNNKQEEIVQPSPPGSSSPQETVVKNASSATIKGVEVELIAQPTPELSFSTALTYTDAKFDEFFNDVNGDLIPDDVSTLSLRRAPKYQASVTIDYSRPLGNGVLDFNTTLRFISAYQTCVVPNRPTVVGAVRNDDRCLTRDREDLAAQVSYTFNIAQDREIRVAIFGRNLTDFRDISATLPVAGLFTFAGARPPRTYGAEIAFKF
jgi:iron complex outermembrane recepter protein